MVHKLSKMVILFSISILSCKDFKSKEEKLNVLNSRLIEINDELKNHRIKLNHNLESQIFGNKNISSYSILTYYDADCSECFQQLEKWKDLVAHFQGLNQKTNIKFILYTEDTLLVNIYLKNINFPKELIVYDLENNFLSKFRHASEKAFNSMLVDKKKKIVFIGSPLISEKIKKHFSESLISE